MLSSPLCKNSKKVWYPTVCFIKIFWWMKGKCCVCVCKKYFEVWDKGIMMINVISITIWTFFIPSSPLKINSFILELFHFVCSFFSLYLFKISKFMYVIWSIFFKDEGISNEWITVSCFVAQWILNYGSKIMNTHSFNKYRNF